MPSNRTDETTVKGFEGNYRILRLLGRGTMASVYLAEQVSMARPVALKILSSELSSNPSFVETFLREARASARLNHPNIVSAIDFGESDSRFFLAMEFIDGMPLSALLERDGVLDEKRVIAIGQQVLSALQHAVQHNVIHLDVKPANIMICKDGRVKLTDFGLAMLLDNPQEAASSRKAMGTPYYMSPEQVEGGALDWRSDQYSLGASLYEAATGRKPFQGNSVSDILVKRFFEKPEPAWSAGRKRVSRAFSAVLSKMLSRSPDGRYQSFEDLEIDFSRVKVGKKPAIAKMTSGSSMTAPTSAAWNSFGYAGVVDRVDTLQRSRRWTLMIYSSILVLFFLGVYSLFHVKELVGPKPPAMVDEDLVATAEDIPPDVGAEVREIWMGANRLMMRAELEPSEDGIKRAVYSYRLIYSAPEFAKTAYADAGKRRVERLLRQLRVLGVEYDPDEESPADE